MHIRQERSSRCSSSTLRHYPPTDLPRGEGSAAARARTNDVALPRFPTVSQRGPDRATLTVELTYSELMEGRLRNPVRTHWRRSCEPSTATLRRRPCSARFHRNVSRSPGFTSRRLAARPVATLAT